MIQKNNSVSSAETKDDSSTKADVTTSSPNNTKPNVGGSFCPNENDDKNPYKNFFKFLNNQEEIKLKWWEKILRTFFCFFLGLSFITILKMANNSQSRKERIKSRLKYFNPTIKKDWWGDEKIEWVGRDKPLTDEEVEAIWKS